MTTPSLKIHKYHGDLSKNIIAITIATLAFIIGFIAGLYEIIEGELFFETKSELFGVFVICIGVLTPWIITHYLLKWEKEQTLDFALVLFTLILNIILIAIYIFLPTVLFTIIQFWMLAFLTMGIGMGCLLQSIKLIPKKKWRLGGFLLIMGNHLLLLGSYCLIGGVVTL